jgi:hypothetical protein
VIPFAALALVAWLAQRAPQAAAPGLRAEPLVAARAASETLRLRNALEAFRFAEGRWPDDLDELARRGFAAPAMAGESASPYSLSVPGAGFAVLAPEY